MRIEVVGIAVIALAAFVFSGCDAGASKSNTTKAPAKDSHGHDHKAGDDHDHAGEKQAAKILHGKNGGHIVELKPADLVAEWCHSSDNDVIKVFVLNQGATANQAVKADSVTIRATAGSNKEPYTLSAVAANEAGEAAEYKLDDKQLALAMTLGVVLEIKVGDKTYSAEIPAHAPHSH